MPETHAVPPPVPLSLIACERVITDGLTGQYSIIGIMAHLQCPGFPVQVPLLCVYTELTNGRGLAQVVIRIVDANEERSPVAEATLQVQMEHPLAVGQFAVGLPGLIFPEPGEYRVQLLVGGELLIERRLVFVPVNR